jgi:hypothetical protein
MMSQSNLHTCVKVREFLKSELERRKKRNPAYSLRSFAKDLNIDPSAFSRILLSRRKVPSSLIEICLDRFGPEEVLKEGPNKKNVVYRSTKLTTEQDYDRETDLEFLTLRYAVNLTDFEMTVEWVSERLGVTLERAQELIKLAQKVGLERPGPDTRKLHRQAIQLPMKQIIKLQRQQNNRVINELSARPEKSKNVIAISTVLPIDSSRYSEVASLMNEYKKKLHEFCITDGQLDEVFLLNFSMTRLTEPVRTDPRKATSQNEAPKLPASDICSLPDTPPQVHGPPPRRETEENSLQG